ncbi:TetR/AcrR family transcriptional regulator [Desulfovibrio sp. OttesenSCG-928-G15]|nr:TetR/AcrR family transcriptional regulator [Desulfovibrio sp. OttesenSCG-928-G15]
MSAERLRQAALIRFADQGYDVTTLADIASDVGIKPPSIYAHFRSKQALFQEVMEFSFANELEGAARILQRPEPVSTALKNYFYGTLHRFENDPNLRFWLRSIYLPPRELVQEIRENDKQFAASLEKLIARALCHSQYGLRNSPLPHETLAASFIGILRGLHAELLYCGNENSNKILSALWTIFHNSLAENAS